MPHSVVAVDMNRDHLYLHVYCKVMVLQGLQASFQMAWTFSLDGSTYQYQANCSYPLQTGTTHVILTWLAIYLLQQ